MSDDSIFLVHGMACQRQVGIRHQRQLRVTANFPEAYEVRVVRTIILLCGMAAIIIL